MKKNEPLTWCHYLTLFLGSRTMRSMSLIPSQFTQVQVFLYKTPNVSRHRSCLLCPHSCFSMPWPCVSIFAFTHALSLEDSFYIYSHPLAFVFPRAQTMAIFSFSSSLSSLIGIISFAFYISWYDLTLSLVFLVTLVWSFTNLTNEVIFCCGINKMSSYTAFKILTFPRHWKLQVTWDFLQSMLPCFFLIIFYKCIHFHSAIF